MPKMKPTYYASFEKCTHPVESVFLQVFPPKANKLDFNICSWKNTTRQRHIISFVLRFRVPANKALIFSSFFFWWMAKPGKETDPLEYPSRMAQIQPHLISYCLLSIAVLLCVTTNGVNELTTIRHLMPLQKNNLFTSQSWFIILEILCLSLFAIWANINGTKQVVIHYLRVYC